jgi:hypothetical protein
MIDYEEWPTDEAAMQLVHEMYPGGKESMSGEVPGNR